MAPLVSPLLLLCLAASLATCAGTQWSSQTILTYIKKIATSLETGRQGKSMGIAAYVERPGSEDLMGCVGKRSGDGQDLIKIDDSFEIGSITKMFIAVAFLQLQERVYNSPSILEVPVVNFLGHAKVKQLSKSSNYAQILIRDLLSHCSGIGDYMPDIDANVLNKFSPLGQSEDQIRARKWSLTELYRIAQVDPKASSQFPLPPGQCRYSNTGYLLLGELLNRLIHIGWHPVDKAGKIDKAEESWLQSFVGKKDEDAWQKYVERYIFKPAHMKNSYFLTDKTATVKGYAAEFGRASNVTIPPSAAWSAGNIVSTAGDMALFMRNIIIGTFWRNKQKTADLWLNLGGQNKQNYKMNPLADGPTGNSYGLGILKLAWGPGPDEFVIGHSGQTFGFGSAVLWHKFTNTTFVWLQNDASLGSPLTGIGGLMQELLFPSPRRLLII